MAAHCLAVLKELSEGRCTPEQFRMGLSHARWGDCLVTGDWYLFYEQSSDEAIKELAALLIPVYEYAHKRLGKPECAEDWMQEVSNLFVNDLPTYDALTKKQAEMTVTALREYSKKYSNYSYDHRFMEAPCE